MTLLSLLVEVFLLVLIFTQLVLYWRFLDFRHVAVHFSLFWDVARPWLAVGYRHFGLTYRRSFRKIW